MASQISDLAKNQALALIGPFSRMDGPLNLLRETWSKVTLMKVAVYLSFRIFSLQTTESVQRCIRLDEKTPGILRKVRETLVTFSSVFNLDAALITMTPPSCVFCDNEVSGELVGIVLSICCHQCCTKQRNTSKERVQCGNQYCVTRGVAMKKYKRRVNQLELIRHIETRNPENESGPPLKMYLLAELAALPKLSSKRREQIKARRQEDRLEEIRQLEKAHGIDFKAIPVPIRHYLTGDYFSSSKNRQTTLNEVQKRCSVLVQVMQTLTICHRPHPEAAFQFFLDHPNSVPKEFKELREKMRNVFRLEGTRILHYLSNKDLSSLRQTPLRDVYINYIKRDVEALVRGELVRRVGESVADAILQHQACRPRIRRDGDEAKIATKLLEYWNEKDDRDKRVERLSKALGARGLVLPNSCTFCERYLSGYADYDVEEVVGVVEVQAQVPTAFGRYGFSGRVHRELTELLHDRKIDYEKAVRKVIGMETGREESFWAKFAEYRLTESAFCSSDSDESNIDWYSF